jgi:SnoaL-like protein
MTEKLTKKSIDQFVEEWYRALDRHERLDSVKDMLVDEGLEMKFPEATVQGHDGFAEWYRRVLHRFFDEEHKVTKVEAAIESAGSRATVQVLVNWQAKIWDPPAATSQWLGFDANQTWVVAATNSGPRIATYVVNELAPMPGSARL